MSAIRSTVDRDRQIERLLDLLAAGVDDPDSPGVGGEVVDQLAHGLQCAQIVALSHPDDEELQVAALLHDIGHQIVPGNDAAHGRAAGDAVRAVLGQRVAALITLHVPAKRYLVTTSEEYLGALSSTSVHTLANQGGTMTADEIAEYETMPHWRDGLVLRRADDEAKVKGRVVPGIDQWRPIIHRVAAVHAAR